LDALLGAQPGCGIRHHPPSPIQPSHESNLHAKARGAQEAMAAGFLLAVRPLVLTSNTISLLPRWQKLFFDHDGRIPRAGATSRLIAYPDPHASQRERC